MLSSTTLSSSSHPSLSDFKQIQAQLIKSSQPAATKVIESSAFSSSRELFVSATRPDRFTWNTLIRGHSLSPTPLLAVELYIHMLLSGTHPNSYTFPFLLKSCASARAPREGEQIHAHLLKLGLGSDRFIHASLINMYARCGELSDARRALDTNPSRNVVAFTALINGYFMSGLPDEAFQLFDGMLVKDVVSWNAMISGYSRCGRFLDALGIFQEMVKGNAKPDESTMVTVLSACAHSCSIGVGKFVHSYVNDRGFGPNLRIDNALIDMYSKCGDLDKARTLFDGLSRRDRISWNVMIGGYAYSRYYKEALALFREMQLSSEEPSEVTFLNVLPAVAHLGALDIGKWIQAYVDKNMKGESASSSTSLYSSLIDMYSKCGSIESAEQVFTAMRNKSVSCWNAMISGLAMHGHSDKALKAFKQMAEEGLEPDEITFVGVLSACSHAGLIAAGEGYFHSMVRDHNISPRLEHYGCMVDLLSGAGLFDEAIALIKKMEVKPDGAIWGSLLGACQIQGNIQLGEYVANNLLGIEIENPGNYVLLSNIYAKAGRWEDVARIRTSLNDKGLKKEPGCSSVEVDGIVHEFLVGDKSHPRSREIYVMLEEIEKKLELNGHVPDTSEVLYDMEEEWKKGVLCYHSEKLAIAFGLISTTPGTTVRIVKNLRVCGNCHSATKLISKIYNREIIARDRSRFHHFRNGVCSCNDYW